MNRFLKYLLIGASLLVFCNLTYGQDTIIRYKKVLVPNYVNFQYAGNYGAYLIGAGYYLNKKQTLDFVFGYGYTSEHKAAIRIHNVYIKGNYFPVTWDFKKAWFLSPLLDIAVSRQFSGGDQYLYTLTKNISRWLLCAECLQVSFWFWPACSKVSWRRPFYKSHRLLC